MTFYIINRILSFIVIYLISYLGFYISRYNKYSSFIPALSIIWFTIVFYCGNTLFDFLFPDKTAEIDYAVLYYGLKGLPLMILVTEIIRYVFFRRKVNFFRKSNWIQVVIFSIYPILSILSFTFYTGYGFLDIAPLLFIGFVAADKLIILIYQNFFKYTLFKILLVCIFFDYGSYEIIGEILIVVTDCLTGYIFLKAKQDTQLRCSLKAIWFR